MASLDPALLERAASWVATAPGVHVYGQWGDSVPASELYFRLFRIGRPVWLHSGGRSAAVAGGLLRPEDAVVVFDRRGRDAAALALLRDAEQAGGRTVAVTGDPRSPVARAADVALFGGVRTDDRWTELFAGRAADSLAGSILWFLVAQRVPGGLGFTPGGVEANI
jgi:DNA-binding MurR/RpiR family transcriptional regulator